MCVETLNMYKRERTSEFTHTTIPQRRKTPSFSSSLLDSIYRSIDESDGQDLQGPLPFCESMQKQSKKQSSPVFKQNSPLKRMSDFDKNIIIEEWIEKQNTRNRSRSSLHFNSSSSCSNSSSGGGTHSSWSDTDRKQNRSGRHPHFDSRNAENHQKKTNQGNGFSKTKLRALKIYGELKKVKQPISPGGRITSFLNSIFSSGNVKKAKMCYVGAVEDVSFERKSSKSVCSSSVSSYSRPCMSKTNSGSRTPKSMNTTTMKRSVRFYPVSVILGEDSKPCGHKSLDDRKLMPLPLSLQLPTVEDVLKNSHLKEKDCIGGYKKYLTKSDFDTSGLKKNVYGEEEEDDDDESDYAESYASSDLFELDHLIGVGRYREELPVYETTSLKKNQAIANGLML